ncbi:hypothetical protein Hte_006039 [Hypoxylon texense]
MAPKRNRKAKKRNRKASNPASKAEAAKEEHGTDARSTDSADASLSLKEDTKEQAGESTKEQASEDIKEQATEEEVTEELDVDKILAEAKKYQADRHEHDKNIQLHVEKVAMLEKLHGSFEDYVIGPCTRMVNALEGGLDVMKRLADALRDIRLNAEALASAAPEPEDSTSPRFPLGVSMPPKDFVDLTKQVVGGINNEEVNANVEADKVTSDTKDEEATSSAKTPFPVKSHPDFIDSPEMDSLPTVEPMDLMFAEMNFWKVHYHSEQDFAGEDAESMRRIRDFIHRDREAPTLKLPPAKIRLLLDGIENKNLSLTSAPEAARNRLCQPLTSLILEYEIAETIKRLDKSQLASIKPMSAEEGFTEAEFLRGMNRSSLSGFEHTFGPREEGPKPEQSTSASEPKKEKGKGKEKEAPRANAQEEQTGPCELQQLLDKLNDPEQEHLPETEAQVEAYLKARGVYTWSGFGRQM